MSAIVAPTPSRSAVAIMRAATANPTLQSTAGPTQCVNGGALVTLPAPVLSVAPSRIRCSLLHSRSPPACTAARRLSCRSSMPIRIWMRPRSMSPNCVSPRRGATRNRCVCRRAARTPVYSPATFRLAQAPRASAIACWKSSAIRRSARLYVDPPMRRHSKRDALVDPYGLVFDSSTGAPVNGARVRLIDAATGAPATVFGDDGVSTYPAGDRHGPVRDRCGRHGVLAAGGCIPFPAGRARQLSPRSRSAGGSRVSVRAHIAELAQTPGAPFRLNAGLLRRRLHGRRRPDRRHRHPVDPAATQLFMQKSTTTTVAAIGDFVQYTLTVENTATNAAVAELRIDRQSAGRRALSRRFDAHRRRCSDAIRRFAVTAARSPSRAARSAPASAAKSATSWRSPPARTASTWSILRKPRSGRHRFEHCQATIQLREELFRERAILMGRVVEGECATAAHQQQGVAGVRVYLEDGRYAVTDEDGKYHFDDVTPGSHVVQLDTVTIPDTHLALSCADRVRHAGRAYSQFVDVRGGALWRSDFVLERKQPPEGFVSLALQTRIEDSVALSLRRALAFTSASMLASVPRRNARVLVMLPDGLTYQPGSARSAMMRRPLSRQPDRRAELRAR